MSKTAQMSHRSRIAPTWRRRGTKKINNNTQFGSFDFAGVTKGLLFVFMSFSDCRRTK